MKIHLLINRNLIIWHLCIFWHKGKFLCICKKKREDICVLFVKKRRRYLCTIFKKRRRYICVVVKKISSHESAKNLRPIPFYLLCVVWQPLPKWEIFLSGIGLGFSLFTKLFNFLTRSRVIFSMHHHS